MRGARITRRAHDDGGGDRGRAGVERLVDADALRSWLRQAGLVSDAGSRVGAPDVARARSLREVIHRCGRCSIRGEPFRVDDLEALNVAAAHPPLAPQLRDGALVYVGRKPVEAALAVVAADALHLLGSTRRQRIRECPGCAMMFEDTSRPGKRRWCSSARGCGNRAKLRKSRARRAARPGVPPRHRRRRHRRRRARRIHRHRPARADGGRGAHPREANYRGGAQAHAA